MVKENYKNKLDGNDLDLSLMSLAEIPVKEIAAIPKATQIDLSCNHITSIPVQFCSLKNIVRLDLSRNEISFLPEAFGDLQKLQSLDLYNNKLQMLPVSFCQLQNLKWLDLKNNPLTSQLKKIAGDCLDVKQCQNCAKHVVQFMQNVQNQMLAEQEKIRQQQEESAALRKIQEEVENEKLRKAKKAAKERKRAALLAEKKEKQKQQDSQSSDSQTYTKSGESCGALKQVKKTEQLNSGSMGCVSFLWKIFVFLFTIASITIGLLYIYTKGDFSEASIRLALQTILKDVSRLLIHIENLSLQFFAWLQNDGLQIMKIVFSYCNSLFWDVFEIISQVCIHLMGKVAFVISNLKAA